MTKTTDDITVSDARLDDLEADIELAMSDLGWDLERAIGAVVADSDFVPDDEQSAVAVEMLNRLEDSQ